MKKKIIFKFYSFCILNACILKPKFMPYYYSNLINQEMCGGFRSLLLPHVSSLLVLLSVLHTIAAYVMPNGINHIKLK